MRTWWLLGALGVVFAGGVYGGSPYFAASNLRETAAKGDADALDELVDFPSVRESLKAQMNAAMMAKMQSDPEMANNPFAGLGMMLAPTIIERAVDAYVTPEGMAAIVRGKKPAGASKAEAANPEPDYKSEWLDLDTFRVTPVGQGANDPMPSFIFKRQGFASWELTKIEFPENFLGSQ